MFRRTTVLVVICFTATFALADNNKIRRRKAAVFSSKNIEFVYALGGTAFMGDVGGSKGDGSRFVKDYDFRAMRPVMTLGAKYRTKTFCAFQADFSYGYLSGSDRYSKNLVRHNRNLSFRSPIFEFALTGQVYIGRKNLGNLYAKKTTRGASFKIDPHPYVFAGIGFLSFNPQGKYQGTWYDLQPLGTEGQGLKPGFNKYSKNTWVIPFGVGVRNAINKNLNAGLEISARKTFTDYIDDVSTTYYDNATIKQQRGDAAAYLADPNLGLIPGATLPNGDGSGAQRGGTFEDAYFFVQISLNYRLGGKNRQKSKF